MLPPGFISSSLAITSRSGSGNSRVSETAGVLPTHSKTDSATDSVSVSTATFLLSSTTGTGRATAGTLAKVRLT